MLREAHESYHGTFATLLTQVGCICEAPQSSCCPTSLIRASAACQAAASDQALLCNVAISTIRSITAVTTGTDCMEKWRLTFGIRGEWSTEHTHVAQLGLPIIGGREQQVSVHRVEVCRGHLCISSGDLKTWTMLFPLHAPDMALHVEG